MHRLICIVFIVSHVLTFQPYAQKMKRSHSFSGFETSKALGAPKSHELPASHEQLRRHYPIQVLKDKELYQVTLGPDLYAVMFRVKKEGERLSSGFAKKNSSFSENWHNFFEYLMKKQEEEAKDDTYDALVNLRGQFSEYVDLWICMISDHAFASSEEFYQLLSLQEKIKSFYHRHVVMIVSSATEGSVPIIENLGIFRNASYKGKLNYPRLSMVLHSFSAAVMQEVYSKKYLFLIRPLEKMKKIFLKKFPEAKNFYPQVVKDAGKKEGKPVKTPTGLMYGDTIVYPSVKDAEQKVGGIYTTLGWLRPTPWKGISMPLNKVADAYFKSAVFKSP